VLFTSLVGHGIVHPMVPFARALVGAGHRVAFATGEHFCPWIERLGFEAFPAGLHREGYLDELRRRFPEYPGQLPRESLLNFHLTKECPQFLAPAMLKDALAIARQWQPTVLVHDMTDFSGPLVASLVGIPYAGHSWTILFPSCDWLAAADAMAGLWKANGLEPPPLAGMFRHLYLDICPRSLQMPSMAGLPTARPVRPLSVHLPLDGHGRAESLPDWFAGLPEAPNVYVTFGTIFNKTPTLFPTVLDGLSEEPVNVLVATGHDVDPHDLGALPDNARAERYLPQPLVLDRSDVVVCHGGAGIMFASLSSGVPLLLVPQGVDQFNNADRCVARGVARVIPPGQFTADAVRTSVRALLAEPSFRENARAVQVEIAQMPGPDAAVGMLESVAATPA
jgi:UDP:flavonoid glycosyltransferase YjiC (YdhE family)